MSRAPITDEELARWAKVRADDAGQLARELIAYRRSADANYRLGRWLSVALEDPNVCEEMKADINAWINAGRPDELKDTAVVMNP